MKHIAAVTLSTAVLAVLIAGCGGASSSSSPSSTSSSSVATGHAQHGGTLTVGIDDDPGTLDPIDESGLGQDIVARQIFDPLLETDVAGNLEPGLATSWHEVNALTYVLHLRHGVTFTDGTPFNAAAVAFNLKRMGSATSSFQALVGPIKSVTASNPYTVVIHLSHPYSPLLDVLSTRAGFMVSPTAFRKEGVRGFAKHPVGTGPFELVSWVPNTSLTLKANPHYWMADRPYLAGLQFEIIPDETTKAISLVTGQIQMMDNIDGADIDRVQNQSGIVYRTWPGLTTVFLALNPYKYPFTDEAVRQAVDIAVNRAAIAKVEFGLATPARSMASPALWSYSAAIPPIPYDPAAARKLLGGKHYTITMQVPPSYPEEAQVVKADLAAVGITANIESLDWTTIGNYYHAKNFVLQVEDGSPTWPDPNDSLASFYLSDGVFNGSGYADPTVEAYLTRAEETTNRAARKADYLQVQKIAQQIAPYVPLVSKENATAWSAKVHNVQEWPTGVPYLRDVWLQH